MSYVFICYSKHNKEYADLLANHLQQKGFNIWIDRVNVEYGVRWWDAILEGLRECGAMTVVMTPESKASDWVQDEVIIAKEWGKPIFPLLLNGDNWEIFFSTQYADVRDASMPDTRLLEQISHYVTPRKKSSGDDKSSLTPESQESVAILPPHFDVDREVEDLRKASDAKEWSQALENIGRIRASGEIPAGFDLDDSEQHVRTEIEKERHQRESSKVAALIGQPFEWIKVPGGSVVLRDASDYSPPGTSEGTYDVPPFAISKHPVTVAQYEVFLGDGGYDQQEFWTEPGWEWRQKEGITLPLYWENEDWHQPNFPVVGVSWYEAIAYCRWLSQKAEQNITLPTELQWQRAAQGNTDWHFPWGNEFDPNRCHFHEKGAVAVTEYPNGGSPFGVMNMSGNVWEWCLTNWDEHETPAPNVTNMRVLRGGSWKDTVSVFLRVTLRYWGNVLDRDHNIGFRCVHF